MSECIQVSTAVPDEDTAGKIVGTLVRERLAACAQVLGPISSTYWWRGEVEQTPEWYCLLKTTRGAFTALQHRLRELHPYEVPEIIAVPILDGSPEYLQWIDETVGGAHYRSSWSEGFPLKPADGHK